MADTTFQTVDAAPAPSGGGGGPPKWLLIGGAAAVGVGLFVFLRKGGPGAATDTKAVPTQTQESLAVGDLAYQVQNGLGALGVQAAKNQSELVQGQWNIGSLEEANATAIATAQQYLTAGQYNIGAMLTDYFRRLSSGQQQQAIPGVNGTGGGRFLGPPLPPTVDRGGVDLPGAGFRGTSIGYELAGVRTP